MSRYPDGPPKMGDACKDCGHTFDEHNNARKIREVIETRRKNWKTRLYCTRCQCVVNYDGRVCWDADQFFRRAPSKKPKETFKEKL